MLVMSIKDESDWQVTEILYKNGSASQLLVLASSVTSQLTSFGMGIHSTGSRSLL
jgi:hypothetical protein